MAMTRASLRKRMVVVEREDESEESSEEEEAEFQDDDYEEEEEEEEEDKEEEKEEEEEKEKEEEEEEKEKRPKHKGRITISLKGQKVCKVCKATDHRAGFVGYVYMDCPNKPCYLCRTPGHTTLTCPHRTATEHGVVAAPRRRSLGLLDFVHERQLRSNLPTVHLPQVIPNKVYSAIIRLHSRRVTDMEFHPTNDNILISGDKRGQIGIWDFEKVFNKTVHEDIHAALVNSIKFHPWQEGMMYTASSDGKVCFTDLESGTSSDILDLNPDGWAGPSTWRSIHGMNLNNRRELALATDNFGFLYQLDTRANKKVEKPMLVHKKNSKVVGVDCHPVDSDVFLTCGNDHKTRLWDMRKLAPDSCLAELDHPRVVTSAYFSPITGNKIMTTCLDNRIRVWDNICADLSEPSREIVHSHNFNRYITSFRAEWDPKDRSECLVVIGRYISDHFDGALLHPIDFLDVSNGRLLEEVYDKSITTICTVNKLHPRLDCMATGSSRSLFIWRPKDAIRDAPENEAETSEEKEVKKITLQIYEADGGKAGRAKVKSIDNDDDDFAFMKKKVTVKATTNGAGPSTCTKKEKSKRKSKSEDDDDSGDDTEEPSPEKGKAVVTPPSEGRQSRRRRPSTCTKKEKSKRKSKSEDDEDSGDDTEEPSPEKGKAVVTPPSGGRQLRRRSK